LASLTPAPSSYSPASSDRRSFSVRPVASDFFEDAPPHAVAKTITPSSERHTLPIVPETSALPSSEQIQAPSSLVPAAPAQGVREHDSHRFSGPNGAYSFARSHPSPTAPRLSKGPAPFRQVTMSALDDVMSRIKGALDNMQVDAGRGASSNEPMDWRTSVSKPKIRVIEPSISTRTLSKDAKWLPPHLRQPQLDLDQEVFGPTCCEPPCSPRPVTLVVKLPTILRPVDAVPKRQLHLLKHSFGHVRLDTLSDGMNKRDLSVNEILFKRPPSGKGNKPRYRVQLPRATRTHSASLPKVNLPSGFPKINTAPGRSKAVDDLPTWRRGPLPSTTQKTARVDETSPILDVTSCSPPPELPALPSEPTVTQEGSTKLESYLVRQRTQPKLPAGSAVGFYRDPGPSFQDSKTTVNFIVSSELEEAMQVSRPESSMLLSSSIAGASAATIPCKGSASPEVNHDIPTLSLITHADGKVSEESVGSN
jgi:serine/arginine repetitive matrix protein 2